MTSNDSVLATSVQKVFLDHFSTQPLVVCAPGRVNLIGEHTDYNEGFVLPAAVDKAVYIAIAPSTSSQGKWVSLDFNESVDIDFQQIVPLPQRWANYILGIVDQLQKSGKPIPLFDCVVAGDVPIGSGMSSSAALESAVVYALNELHQLGLSRWEMALLAQKSENEFIGVKCGIMDMFASLHGKANHVIRLDCRDLSFEYFPIQLGDYRIVLFDTGVKHSLADSAYNARRAQCEEGVRFFQKHYGAPTKSLRDVPIAMVQANRSRLSAEVYNRCLYVTEEIQRTLAACEDLKNGDLAAFGLKMFATHEGLRHLYEVSCIELDFLVDAVQGEPAVLGARMMGGGFGGCTINLVHKDAIDALYKKLAPAYLSNMQHKLGMYMVVTGEGAHVVE
ncbi:galactokinase [Haliscomenobacter hydrossis]|uniref:Galactokinase n=1 Tax=Haliscomenobacter hydrossis (strain ATCC 27775 / DSM 1100 / LMG 10767 / O) TaxID=760192 RepID=F4KSG5_HALH1|nr:galactokinase [Haliscomenobacter hydrossis]AEE54316.1 galactokinase [Haliscomenobacter hydrossis DSM 1100]